MSLSDLRATLLAARNADGGWGYRPGNKSRLEPTCWSLLALARADRQPIDLDVLLKWPSEDQWLVDVPGAPANISFNALAALTFLEQSAARRAGQGLIRLIVDAKGRRLDQAAAFRQDNSLQAWSWVDGTFSWVEPTAWCLLVVKKMRTEAGPESGERIRVAEAMLRDRACSAGGWNYGSSNVYGQELYPYVTTTALGLIAMQDLPGDPIVARAIAHLESDFAREPTPTALALTVIALTLHHRPVTAPQARLAARMSDEASSTLSRAMTLYALAGATGGHDAFKL
jgi:hypothetical protein